MYIPYFHEIIILQTSKFFKKMCIDLHILPWCTQPSQISLFPGPIPFNVIKHYIDTKMNSQPFNFFLFVGLKGQLLAKWEGSSQMWHFLTKEVRARDRSGLCFDWKDEETCPTIPHVKQETFAGLNAVLTILLHASAF